MLKHLTFKQSERITTVDQQELIATFLFTPTKHMILRLLKDQMTKFHHVGFEVDDVNAVFRAADILSMYEVPFDVTPTRHGVTRGQTIYFYDPSGNRNEAFAGGNMAYRDMKVITWTEDRIGQGVFYHRRELLNHS